MTPQEKLDQILGALRAGKSVAVEHRMFAMLPIGQRFAPFEKRDERTANVEAWCEENGIDHQFNPATTEFVLKAKAQR